MRTRIGLLLLVMVTLATAGIAFRQEEIADFFSKREGLDAEKPPDKAGRPNNAGRSAGGLDLLSPFKTEEQWIHASICEDIAAKVCRASSQWGGASGSLTLPTVKVERRSGSSTWDVRMDSWQSAPGLTWSFDVSDFVWSPSTYVEWPDCS